MKRNHSDHKRNMNSSNSRERHSRRRDEESEDDISDDDISDNHDEIVDSEYDDEDVDDSLSTKSSRIHQNNHRGRHQSSNRSNSRPVRDSSRPRSSVRYFHFEYYLTKYTQEMVRYKFRNVKSYFMS